MSNTEGCTGWVDAARHLAVGDPRLVVPPAAGGAGARHARHQLERCAAQSSRQGGETSRSWLGVRTCCQTNLVTNTQPVVLAGQLGCLACK